MYAHLKCSHANDRSRPSFDTVDEVNVPEEPQAANLTDEGDVLHVVTIDSLSSVFCWQNMILLGMSEFLLIVLFILNIF